MFNSIFGSVSAPSITTGTFFIAVVVALVTGILVSFLISFRMKASKGYYLTLSLLPGVVTMAFGLINLFLTGATNITARLLTVAVAFGLIRFRSVPGKAQEMLLLFLDVVIVFAFGLGLLAYGVIFALLVVVLFILLTYLPLFRHKKARVEQLLKITIPETLDYSFAFDDIFKSYLKEEEVVEVKTTNMGSMFRISYKVTLKDPTKEKNLIDDLRTRNGNLEITLLPYAEPKSEL